MRFGQQWIALTSIALVWALGGCAGETIGDSPSGGTSGLGGTNESGGAGSANLPEARGASRVFPTSSGCGPGPYVIPAEGTPTSERVAGDRVTDGAEGDVDCSVTPSGSGYRVLLNLEEGPSSFSAAATLEPVPDGPFTGTGSVGFYHPNAGNIMSETCMFEVLQNQEIGTGKVWGNFSCVESMKEANPGFACNFEGSFIAENCG